MKVAEGAILTTIEFNTLKLASGSLTAVLTILQGALIKTYALMLRNPITAAIAGFMALGVAIYSVVKHRQKEERQLIERLKLGEEEAKKMRDQSQLMEKNIARYEELITNINKTTQEEEELLNIKKAIIAQSPELLDSIGEEGDIRLKSLDVIKKESAALKEQASLKEKASIQAKMKSYSQGLNAPMGDTSAKMWDDYKKSIGGESGDVKTSLKQVNITDMSFDKFKKHMDSAASTHLDKKAKEISLYLEKIQEMIDAEAKNLYKGYVNVITQTTIEEVEKIKPALIETSKDMAFAVTNTYAESLTKGMNSTEANTVLNKESDKIQNFIKKMTLDETGAFKDSFKVLEDSISEGSSFAKISAQMENEVWKLVDAGMIEKDQMDIMKKSWMKALDIRDIGEKVEGIFKDLGIKTNKKILKNFNSIGMDLSNLLLDQIESISTSEAKIAFLEKMSDVTEGFGGGDSLIMKSLNSIAKNADLTTGEGIIETTQKIQETIMASTALDKSESFDIAKSMVGDIPQEMFNEAWIKNLEKVRKSIETSKTLKESILKGSLSPDEAQSLMSNPDLPKMEDHLTLNQEGLYEVDIAGLMEVDRVEEENHDKRIRRTRDYYNDLKIYQQREIEGIQEKINLNYLEDNTGREALSEEELSNYEEQLEAKQNILNITEKQLEHSEELVKITRIQTEEQRSLQATYGYMVGQIQNIQQSYDLANSAIEQMNTTGEISMQMFSDLLSANMEYIDGVTVSAEGVITLKENFAEIEKQLTLDVLKTKFQAQADELKAENIMLTAKKETLQAQMTMIEQALLNETITKEIATKLMADLEAERVRYNTTLLEQDLTNFQNANADKINSMKDTIWKLGAIVKEFFMALAAGSVMKIGSALGNLWGQIQGFVSDKIVANFNKIEYQIQPIKFDIDGKTSEEYRKQIEGQGQLVRDQFDTTSKIIQANVNRISELENLANTKSIQKLLDANKRVAAAEQAAADGADTEKKALEALADAARKAAEVLQKLADIERDFIENAKQLKFDFVAPFISNLQSMINGIDDYMKGFDKFYNYVRKMDRVEIQQGIVEGLTQSPLLKGEDYLQGINAQIGLVIGKSAIRVDYIGNLREDLEEQQEMIKEKYGEYYNFDVNGEIYLDYPNLDSDIDEVMTDAFTQIDDFKQQANAKEMEVARLGGVQSANDLLLNKAKSELDTVSAAQKEVLNNEELMKTPEGQSYVAQYGADIARLTGNVEKYTTVADGYNASLDSTNTELEALNFELSAMEDGLSQKEEYISDMTDAADTYAETYARLQEQIQGFIEDQAELIELRQQIIQVAISTEQEVYDALVETREKEINDKKKKYDEYKKMDQDYLATVRKIIEEERALRDKDKSAFDLQQKQKRAALLGRDTSGAYGAELAALQKEISTDRQALYDKQVDERVDSLEDEINSRQELIDKELEMLQSALDYYKENTQLLWQEVAALMNDGADSVMAVLEGTATYMNGSELQRQVAREGWEKNVQISIDAVTTSWLAQIDNMIEGYQTMIDEFPEVVQALEEAEEGFGGAGETLLENMSNFTDQWQSVVDEAVNATGGTFQQAAADIDAAVASMVASFRAAQAAFATSNADLVASTIEEGTGATGSGNYQDIAHAKAEAARGELKSQYPNIDPNEDISDPIHDTPEKRLAWFMSYVANRPESEVPRAAKDLLWEIVEAGFEWWGRSAPAKPYKEGGLVNYTGLAQVHGSTSSPEAFLSSSDTANIAELTKILREIKIPTFTIPSTSSNAIMNGGGQVFDFDDININVNIAKVDNDVDLKELEKVVEQTVLNTLTAKVVNNVGRRF